MLDYAYIYKGFVLQWSCGKFRFIKYMEKGRGAISLLAYVGRALGLSEIERCLVPKMIRKDWHKDL